MTIGEVVIRPIALADIEATRDCVRDVMRERRWVGFVIEGTRTRGKKLDGEYDDVHPMGMQLAPSP